MDSPKQKQFLCYFLGLGLIQELIVDSISTSQSANLNMNYHSLSFCRDANGPNISFNVHPRVRLASANPESRG